MDREQAFNATDYGRAVVNILEDSAVERVRLRDTQRAVVNILEDSAVEKVRLRDTQRAVVNILEDSASEKVQLQMTQKAVLNILEDSSTEKRRLEEIQKAVLNILDDLAGEMDERKQAHERVRQRTAALEIANKELESFAYSVSHDLRAPLRAIDGFGHKLEVRYADRLDAEGQRILHVVRDNARRMGQLIDDLLAFSRMGRREMLLAPVDMAGVVNAVVEELRAAEPAERKIEVEIAALPTAHGDMSMLRQLWFNLLSNAFKFTRSRAAARIAVGGSRDGAKLLFWVKDNGVGFNMQYADKLFGVFQRLHAMEEFEGTGVGLALCQRIAHRHGGAIDAEASLDAGATFSFTLPVQAAG